MLGTEMITKGQGETLHVDEYVHYLDYSDGSQLYSLNMCKCVIYCMSIISQ